MGGGPTRGAAEAPTRSDRPVYFWHIEDEAGLLQATMFEGIYRR